MAGGRPPRSRNPERAHSDELRALTRALAEMHEEELVIAHALVAHERARRAGFSHEAGRPDRYPTEAIIAALLETDRRLFDERGTRLQHVKEYATQRPDWGPSLATIYRRFTSWENARAAAGLLEVPQPAAHLLVKDGRPYGGGRSPSTDDCLLWMAACLEEMCGRRFGKQAYVDFRRLHPGAPSYIQIIDKPRVGPARRSWDEMMDAACAHARAHPSDYPKAAAFLNRGEAT